MIGWGTFVWVPPVIVRWRIVITLTVVAMVVVPFWTYLMWSDGVKELLYVMTIMTIVFWIPQAISIAFVHGFVFRKWRTRRKARR